MEIPENEKAKENPTDARIRRQNDAVATIAATALGPIFLKIGDALGLVYGAGAIAYFLVCILVVPLLTLAAGRLKYLAWQLAVVSLSLTTLGDSLRLGVMPW